MFSVISVQCVWVCVSVTLNTSTQILIFIQCPSATETDILYDKPADARARKASERSQVIRLPTARFTSLHT